MRITAGVAAAACRLLFGREKFIHREIHFAEQIARIVGIGAAFLGGHAVIVYRHQHLDTANQLYNGKHTDGDAQNAAIIILAEGTVKPA